MNSYVITFESTHCAIEGEKKLQEAGYTLYIIPTPRQITANCGLSIKLNFENGNHLKEILKELKIYFEGLYLMESFTSVKKVS